MIKKLRWKFVCVMTALSMIVLSIVFVSSFLSTKNTIEKESEESLRRIAEMQQIQMIGLPRFEADDIRVPFFSVDVSNHGVISNLRSNYFEMKNSAEGIKEEDIINIVAASLNAEENMGVLDDEGLRYYRKQRMDGWRVVFLDMTMENNTINNLLANMTFIGLGSLLGILALSVILSYWLTKPVERAWNQQRQFVADASHELKTPLTVILSNTDMLLSHEMNPTEGTQWRLGNIRAESIRMKGLVEDLLYLARSDAGNTPKVQQQVSMTDIVMDSVLLFEALAFEKQKELQYQLQENLYVMSNENSIKQLMEILLDNAMKYSGEQGCIWVKLERNSAKTLRLMVANTGDIMTEEECKRIFERFYRTDPARENNGGYGLGLAIASSIVDEMEGKIWCESRNGVNSFYVQLPVCRDVIKEEIKELKA